MANAETHDDVAVEGAEEVSSSHKQTLKERFGRREGRRFGDVKRDTRKQLESQGVKTAEQRQKEASARSKYINFRTTETFAKLLTDLSDETGLTKTEIIERGIKLFEAQKGKQ